MIGTNSRPVKNVVVETLGRVNQALGSDPNALVSTRSGDVSPEAAYIELVREILALLHNNDTY